MCNSEHIEGSNMDSTQLLKGVLDVAVLAVIEHEDGYGYDIVRRLKAAGLDNVGDASIYGTLRRLFSAGALTTYVVASEDGPHRKYYGMNETGKRMLTEQRATWATFSKKMSTLLDSPKPTKRAKGGK
jgi:PadR family transcriptional regulator PadR